MKVPAAMPKILMLPLLVTLVTMPGVRASAAPIDFGVGVDGIFDAIHVVERPDRTVEIRFLYHQVENDHIVDGGSEAPAQPTLLASSLDVAAGEIFAGTVFLPAGRCVLSTFCTPTPATRVWGFELWQENVANVDPQLWPLSDLLWLTLHSDRVDIRVFSASETNAPRADALDRALMPDYRFIGGFLEDDTLKQFVAAYPEFDVDFRQGAPLGALGFGYQSSGVATISEGSSVAVFVLGLALIGSVVARRTRT